MECGCASKGKPCTCSSHDHGAAVQPRAAAKAPRARRQPRRNAAAETMAMMAAYQQTANLVAQAAETDFYDQQMVGSAFYQPSSASCGSGGTSNMDPGGMSPGPFDPNCS